jgi:hypothetical protein
VGDGILVDTVPKTNNVGDSDGAHFTANTITVESTTVNAGATKVVKYRVAVN